MSSTTPESAAAGGERYRPARESSEALSGWVVFAAIIMMIGGTLDALWGLAAIINNEVVLVGGHGVVIFDVTAWGWVHLILGSLVVITGLGLLAERTWARVFGVVIVSLDAVAQFGNFTAFPLWSMLLIAIDFVILYHLTVRWGEPAGY
ncbi:MAG TPA: hypothetical protein VGX16_06075 [Solirubrobacteraceae bacterium]|jgi:uncharacterized membrane protein|nr:hypothetical protein [Solirubrobacteraceae bacterium]